MNPGRARVSPGRGLDFAWNAWWVRAKPPIKRKPSEYIRSNVSITISGMFFQPAFVCAYQALGVESIAFAVDYPYQNNDDAVRFMSEIAVPDADKERIGHRNAARLLKLAGY